MLAGLSLIIFKKQRYQCLMMVNNMKLLIIIIMISRTALGSCRPPPSRFMDLEIAEFLFWRLFKLKITTS